MLFDHVLSGMVSTFILKVHVVLLVCYRAKYEYDFHLFKYFRNDAEPGNEIFMLHINMYVHETVSYSEYYTKK